MCHPLFSGNKARKLYHYLKYDYSDIRRVVSFGGNQSNFMLALAQLAHIKQWQMDYWCYPLPSSLKAQPNGNYTNALSLGMMVKHTGTLTLDHIRCQYNQDSQTLFFDQGARMKTARDGFIALSNEIMQAFTHGSVIVACGTGTTALYLQQALQQTQLKVYAIPCVGDTDYLHSQWKILSKDAHRYPEILRPNTKPQFGKLKLANLQTYQDLLLQTGIEFDLLYDPIAWQTLEQHYPQLPQPIIYLHCGGTSGNISMLARYRHAQMLS